jgi:hypothetical protein
MVGHCDTLSFAEGKPFVTVRSVLAFANKSRDWPVANHVNVK